MLTSLALIFLVGMLLASICHRIKLPGIIGMLITGIILGPYVLNLLDPSILSISPDLRQMALVIILIKAGLSLSLDDLKKIGRPAILMSFVPATFEILAFVAFAPLILHVKVIEAAIIGAVLGAVSPAVVVIRMIMNIEENYGTKKKIPQLIMAGSSIDDIFVIVLFTAFVGIAEGNKVSVMEFLNIPISIALGLLVGVGTGFFLVWLFETEYSHKHLVRNSKKVIIVLAVAFLLLAIEEWVKPYVAFSGLLAIMSMALIIAMRSVKEVTEHLQKKFGKLWLAAEVILFVLVGAAVDITSITLNSFFSTLLMIFIGLFLRSIGVLLCLIKTGLNAKEKTYCVIAYLPKATVQAAIGSIPLSMGLPCGHIVLMVAVLSILITAPMGAIGMDLTYNKLLHYDENS